MEPDWNQRRLRIGGSALEGSVCMAALSSTAGGRSKGHVGHAGKGVCFSSSPEQPRDAERQRDQGQRESDPQVFSERDRHTLAAGVFRDDQIGH
jgi:hypothetical protein